MYIHFVGKDKLENKLGETWKLQAKTKKKLEFRFSSWERMSFVLQTVAGLLRGSGSQRNYRVENCGATSNNGCGCHKRPNRCCHKADLLAARNSFSTSFECMNDDLNDWHRSNWPINKQWVFPFPRVVCVCLSVCLSVCLPVCLSACFVFLMFHFIIRFLCLNEKRK